METPARPVQISLNFEPPPNFEDDIDALLIYVIELARDARKDKDKDKLLLKQIAIAADLSPSELSMMMHRTRPFPAKAVHGIIRATLPDGLKVVYAYMDMFLTPQDVKVDRAADVLERYLNGRKEADKAALVIAEAMKATKKK